MDVFSKALRSNKVGQNFNCALPMPMSTWCIELEGEQAHCMIEKSSSNTTHVWTQ